MAKKPIMPPNVCGTCGGLGGKYVPDKNGTQKWLPCGGCKGRGKK